MSAKRKKHPSAANDKFVVPDFSRHARKGVPEVILADGKTVEQSLSIARAFLRAGGRAILSRVGSELEARLRAELAGSAELEWKPACGAAVLRRPGFRVTRTGGRVGILTAGTSDIPAAEEAALLCAEMGCEVFRGFDVGVAGLHRLVGPLAAMIDEHDVDVLVVAAGMDGALPSVVAGLAPVPVVGLPTSVGYGLGGRGIAALYAMLQGCAPGLCVVNIDNGIGAGAVAGMIANRAAMGREKRKPDAGKREKRKLDSKTGAQKGAARRSPSRGARSIGGAGRRKK
jgi:NCAIR mutase (PurE)-related protein